jgi:alpha-mannosidase
LQPILLASRKSCNWAGVWYPQAGDHEYRFALTSHAGDWRQGWRDGIAANHPMQAALPSGGGGDLPPEMSFASVSADDVFITAVKKAEDDDGVAVRTCEMEGRNAPASLRFFRPVKAAEQTSIIEENPRATATDDGTIPFAAGHNSIQTFHLELQ